MTQYPDPYYQQGAAQGAMTGEPPRTSGLAITSFVCGILGCCPYLPSLLAVLFGLAGLVSIGRDPSRRGKGFAIGGLVLGVAGIIAWIVLTVMGVNYFKEMMAFVQNGPELAFKAGAGGNGAAFKGYFHGPGAAASDAEAAAFLAELESRYGAFVSCTMDAAAQQGRPPQFGTPIVPFAYELQFANETVDAEIEIAFSDPQRGGFIFKLYSVEVIDVDHGDLKYPQGGSRGGSGGPPRTPSGTPPGDPPDDAEGAEDDGR